MKILYIITRSDWGGAQVHIFDLLKYMSSSNECYLIVGEEGRLADCARELNIPVWIVPTLVQPIHPIYDILAVYDIKRIIGRVRPEIVHTHSSKAGLVGRIAACLTGIPSVFTAHGWAFTEGVSSFRKKISIPLERFAAKLSKCIICVSQYDCQLALQHRVASSNQLITIHNGIPNEAGVREHQWEEKTKAVMVARFSTQKDHTTLIRAVSRVSSPIELLLVGQGDLMESCRQLVSELHTSDKVSFLGMRKDTPAILSCCDIFILTSHYEGFPISILEAMRAGLPVIASDVGGVKEAVVDGITGYLVPRGNIEVVKERIELLANNLDLRKKMGEAGRQRFLEHFTEQKMLEKTFEVYQEVLHKTP